MAEREHTVHPVDELRISVARRGSFARACPCDDYERSPNVVSLSGPSHQIVAEDLCHSRRPGRNDLTIGGPDRLGLPSAWERDHHIGPRASPSFSASAWRTQSPDDGTTKPPSSSGYSQPCAAITPQPITARLSNHRSPAWQCIVFRLVQPDGEAHAVTYHQDAQPFGTRS